MREPRCYRIVQSKNLWEIAIEFVEKIDNKLMDFNLKMAYITYRICKIRAIYYDTVSKLVFLSCFNNVGKYYAIDNKSDSQIETYLFLKYFSPVKEYSEILISDLNIHKNVYKDETNIFRACYDYTKLLLELNDKDEALNKILENKDNYDKRTLRALEKFVKKVDIFYEFNSFHYKTIIYKYISKTIFSPLEKSKFIAMLSSLFEMYSAQTLYHSKLTAIISYMLAKKMKINYSRRKRIYVAGLCHDLGKVCIPHKILEKPDRLTDREYTTMKKHVTYTKDILASKMDYEIIELAYRHHEKLDGTGYPNKLKGEQITIDQRVLQVADIISALVAKRSYKEAWDIDKTITILEAMANDNKIDKDVVNCFKINQKKLLKASSKFIAQADKIYDKINKERELLILKKNSLNEEKDLPIKKEIKRIKTKIEEKFEENKENKQEDLKENIVEDNKELNQKEINENTSLETKENIVENNNEQIENKSEEKNDDEEKGTTN